MAAAACVSLLLTAFAYFDDTETSTGNTFQAGTWAVSVNGTGNSASHTFQSLNAGDSGSESWTVTNTGSISAYVDVNVSVADSGTGHLGNFLIAHLYISGGPEIHVNAPVNNIAGSYNLNLPLDAGQSKNIILDWSVAAGYIHDDNDQVVVAISFDIRPSP
jgi:predicted ribosomally synthesized peptide with SipW-like signal peptide